MHMAYASFHAAIVPIFITRIVIVIDAENYRDIAGVD